jgi:carbamoyltransferase
MYILGIAGQAHDAAAALIKDGKLIAAAEEERFSRIKHVGIDRVGGFPYKAIEYCLKTAGINPIDINYVSYFLQPNLLFRKFATFRLRRFFHDPLASLYYGVGLIGDLRSYYKTLKLVHSYFPNAVIYEVYHHLGHAASAFFVSPFEKAAILVIDGYGEWTATSLGYGEGNKIELKKEIGFPHSLGLLYGMVTQYLGFEHNSDEYKVMGLASYGQPKFADVFSDIIRFKKNGLYEINLSYFNQGFRGPNYLSNKFFRALGPPRKKDEPITSHHKDIAASLQRRLEEMVFHIAERLHELTNQENLCLAGGVALNCTLNGKLWREGPFKNIYIQPAASDPGIAIGGTYYIYNHLLNNKRDFQMNHAYWGPEYSNKEIQKTLDITKQKYIELKDEKLLKKTAELLSKGKIVGWFQGRMEWGPRALGNRSILADPTRADMKDLINHYVKHREEFRPFAPSIIEEGVGKYFNIPGASPFMLFSSPVYEKMRPKIPSVTHIDGTARVQTVSKTTNERFYNLHKEFAKLRGVPILLNTSFNVAGEPIVCSPIDALRCFNGCGLDVLVIGNFIIIK